MYQHFFKRIFDIICALAALIGLWWVYAIVAILVKTKLGSPVLFTQMRPGKIDPKTGKEKIFKLYKFRTMTNEKDADGNLLPDDVRLTKFGKLLRETSLDEIPEAINILKGDMSVIGPRPQLVKDMVFMTDEQRKRHTVRPGLSGLAQISGRNAISWEGKLNCDLKYIEDISFFGDVKIVLKTVKKAFFDKDGITEDGMVTAEDYGVELLRNGKITVEDFNNKQIEAISILEKLK